VSCNGEDSHINDVPDENECSVGGVEDNVAGDNDDGDADHAILVILCV